MIFSGFKDFHNDNDNDNDTLREVPHRSNEGLALQARVSGPWPHKKESVLQVKLALLAKCASTNCCGQSVVHKGELNVQGRQKHVIAQAVAVLNSR